MAESPALVALNVAVLSSAKDSTLSVSLFDSKSKGPHSGRAGAGRAGSGTVVDQEADPAPVHVPVPVPAQAPPVETHLSVLACGCIPMLFAGLALF